MLNERLYVTFSVNLCIRSEHVQTRKNEWNILFLFGANSASNDEKHQSEKYEQY